MDIFLPKAYSPVLLLPTLVVSGIIFGAFKFNTRISPTIPYAGEQSLADRLQVPVEYGNDPIEFLKKTRKQLGDVFCVDLLVAKIVFVLGAEGNKEVMRAAEDKLSFNDGLIWALGPILKDGKLSASMYCSLLISLAMMDPDWAPPSTKAARAYIMKQSSLDVYRYINVVDEHFEEWAAKGVIPLFKSASYLIISVLIMLFLGEDFYHAHGAELVPLMSQFERDLQSPILRVTPNFLWRFTPPGKRLFATLAKFQNYISTEVAKRLAHPDEHVGKGDYLAFILENFGDRFERYYGLHFMTLVFGGHANAAMTIPWLFLHARRTPGALERIREEALLLPEERKPFIEACIRETGRLYTNTTVMRRTRVPVSVAGHVVPAGTLVAASPVGTQRADLDGDSSAGGIFKNAGKWDPMRFLESREIGGMCDPYATWFQRAEFVHFGLGMHACPGEKLARVMIIDMVLRTWMQKYEVEVVSGLEEGVKGVDGVGAEGAWTEENFGTPSVRGVDPLVSVKRRPVVS